MKFKTEIEIETSSLNIEHEHKIITIGSCFAENIGQKFQEYRFSISDNPFGVLYNPVSIYNAVKIISDNKKFSQEDLVFAHSEWHSFYHHSDFSNQNPFVCLKNINDKLNEVHDFILSANEIILTFGTSFVYKYKLTNEIVSNCHKIAADQFERYRIGMYEAREFIQSTVELLKELNPKLKIILTLSPVRHLKDGVEENQISKAILLLAIHEIVNEDDSVFYFPSYEIVLDDLRDYRFYKEDLIHPSKMAVDYIWGKFAECYFTDNCKKIMTRIEKIVQARNHRVRNIYSEENKKFLLKQMELLDKLIKEYPHLNLEKDKAHFDKCIADSKKNNK